MLTRCVAECDQVIRNSEVEAESKERRASGEIPQIKTAQDKGSHRKKMCDIKIPSGSGDLDLW